MSESNSTTARVRKPSQNLAFVGHLVSFETVERKNPTGVNPNTHYVKGVITRVLKGGSVETRAFTCFKQAEMEKIQAMSNGDAIDFWGRYDGAFNVSNASKPANAGAAKAAREAAEKVAA